MSDILFVFSKIPKKRLQRKINLQGSDSILQKDAFHSGHHRRFAEYGLKLNRVKTDMSTTLPSILMSFSPTKMYIMFAFVQTQVLGL